eukprot:scaffold1147_cov172-Amphora_coffeaeformis.AAC.23
MSESSEEEEFNEDAMEEDEDEELQEDGEEGEGDRKRSAKKNTSYNEDSEDSDSDDDIPLSELAAKAKKKPASKASNGKTAKTPAKKATSKKAPPPAKKTSSVSSDKTYEFASDALYQSECLKGMLIQRLLCRWWYAYDWPDPTSLPAKPPKHYDALDGFPGVYVCTEGGDVGKLIDLRDKEKCPSFRNFANKPSSDLKDLLLKALENQKAKLVEHDGEGTALEKELQGLVKWATKLDPNKADKEALKVLKASKLKL